MTNKQLIKKLQSVVPTEVKLRVIRFEPALINLIRNGTGFWETAYAVCNVLDIPGHSCVKDIYQCIFEYHGGGLQRKKNKL